MRKDPHKKREERKYENPIASREYILDTLERLGEPAGFKKLSLELKCLDEPKTEALKARLQAMVRDGQLVKDSRQIFSVASKVEMKTGKVSAHPDGFGFLMTDDKNHEDIYLSFQQMRQVFHGDKALVRLRGMDRRGRIEGEIVEVLERSTRQLVGRLYPLGDAFVLEPLSKRFPQELLVAREDTGGAIDTRFDGKKAGSDKIVVAELITQPALHEKARARVVEILGDHLTPGIEVEIALRNNDIPSEFLPEVIEEADNLPLEVTREDKKDRKDLTKVPFVTIDGEDARDFDDAVYCEPNSGGLKNVLKKNGWRLWVAIADVSHYIQPDSPLDDSAFDRATSVYFPQYVVPMLPEKLSNGLCSLRPDEERLTMVCEMTISARGRISSYKFYKGVIRSFARLTYNQVNGVLEAGSESDDGLDKKIRSNLETLKSLYLTLNARRKERGALDLDTVELDFQFDEEAKLTKIVPKKRLLAHRLIEEAMLCANVCAARFLGSQTSAGLYRVHEPPEADRVEKLREFLQTLGIQLGGGELPTPGDMQRAIEQMQKTGSGPIFQMAILRSLQQAVYQRANKGHFGLNYKEYAHFTSPIRRYPDLIVHRLIKTVIHSRKKTDKVERFGKSAQKKNPTYSEEQIDDIGEHSSMAERRADAAVYEVLDWIKCDYLEKHVGDSFEGVITGVTAFGMFVELKDLYIEGLVHVSTLVGEYFNYDAASQCLTGDRTNYRYGLGETVQVQVVKVDPEEGKIDFELISHQGSATRRRSTKKRDSKRPAAPARKGAARKGSKKASDRKSKSGRKPKKLGAKPQGRSKTKASSPGPKKGKRRR